MFSDPGSDLALQHRPLWNCFLGRFNDIDVEVRSTCVQASQEFIVHHPELLSDIAGMKTLGGRPRECIFVVICSLDVQIESYLYVMYL